MDLNQIKKIVKIMEDHGLSLFQYQQDDFNLKLKKGNDIEDLQRLLSSLPMSGGNMAPSSAPPAISTAVTPAGPAENIVEGKEIHSPMVGTFYRRPSPDAPNFVEVGDTVSQGQTICIIEAMKVMNEIKAEQSGTITRICADDATAVQYGDPLFQIK